MTTTELTIHSTTVLAAQGVKLTSQEEEILVARADRLRRLTGETGTFPVSIAVRDPYTNAFLGSMTWDR